MSRKILITGASSFLGHHVVPRFLNYQNELLGSNKTTEYDDNRWVLPSTPPPSFEVLTPTSSELNFLDRQNVIDYLRQHQPDTILHMAAKCGGIGANKDAPGTFIHDNMKMTANLFDGIREVNNWFPNRMRSEPVVTRFYGLGTVCAYPKWCPVPFKEDDLWNGFPEETNAPYGQAKRSMLLMQQSFRTQFGLMGAHLIPVNMYGEYDHFDLRNSHVIPALIRKFLGGRNSNDSSVEIWGDGSPTREFLYAGDCAEAICSAIYKDLDYPDPINLGTGKDISIKRLAKLIASLVGFKGDLNFTGEVSVNGQPRRRLDVSRAKEILGFEAQTSLVEGLAKTIEWYEKSLGTNEVTMNKNIDGGITLTTGSGGSAGGALKTPDEITIKHALEKTLNQDGSIKPEILGMVKATDPVASALNQSKRGNRVRPAHGREASGNHYALLMSALKNKDMEALNELIEKAPSSISSDHKDLLDKAVDEIKHGAAALHAQMQHEKAVGDFNSLVKKSKDTASMKELINSPPETVHITSVKDDGEVSIKSEGEVHATDNIAEFDEGQFKEMLANAAKKISDISNTTDQMKKETPQTHSGKDGEPEKPESGFIKFGENDHPEDKQLPGPNPFDKWIKNKWDIREKIDKHIKERNIAYDPEFEKSINKQFNSKLRELLNNEGLDDKDIDEIVQIVQKASIDSVKSAFSKIDNYDDRYWDSKSYEKKRKKEDDDVKKGTTSKGNPVDMVEKNDDKYSQLDDFEKGMAPEIKEEIRNAKNPKGNLTPTSGTGTYNIKEALKKFDMEHKPPSRIQWENHPDSSPSGWVDDDGRNRKIGIKNKSGNAKTKNQVIEEWQKARELFDQMYPKSKDVVRQPWEQHFPSSEKRGVPIIPNGDDVPDFEVMLNANPKIREVMNEIAHKEKAKAQVNSDATAGKVRAEVGEYLKGSADRFQEKRIKDLEESLKASQKEVEELKGKTLNGKLNKFFSTVKGAVKELID